MVAKARGARSQRRDDDGAAGICLPPITAYGLSSEAIEAVERAPPPKPRRQPLHASASEPSLASEWVSDSALAADVGLGLAQMKQQMEREARRQRALERALIERPLAQSLKRSAKSYKRLKSVMSTKLQPLKEHLQRGERSFLMRSTTQRSRDWPTSQRAMPRTRRRALCDGARQRTCAPPDHQPESDRHVCRRAACPLAS